MKCWGASIFNVAMTTDMCHNGLVSRQVPLLSCIKMETQTEMQSRLLCSDVGRRRVRCVASRSAGSAAEALKQDARECAGRETGRDFWHSKSV
jgi:hypothetical protein